MIRCEAVVIDRLRQVVTLDGHELDLTPTEFALLDALLRHPGRAFRRSDLIDAAVGDDTIVLERTIDVHIRSLRRKLGPHADLIQTVRGIGYRAVAKRAVSGRTRWLVDAGLRGHRCSARVSDPATVRRGSPRLLKKSLP